VAELGRPFEMIAHGLLTIRLSKLYRQRCLILAGRKVASHTCDLVGVSGFCRVGGATSANVDLSLLEFAVIFLEEERADLFFDANDPDLLSLEAEGLIVELDWAVGQASYKLLQRVVMEMVCLCDANNVRSLARITYTISSLGR
jgi:hypothetical protein